MKNRPNRSSLFFLSLITIFLTQTTKSDCQFGTLRCLGFSGQPTAAICNTKLGFGYDTNQQSCIKEFIPDCLQISPGSSNGFGWSGAPLSDPNCQICKQDFFWDAENKVCSLLPTTFLNIPNCRVFKRATSGEINCESCVDGFYLSQGQCESLSTRSVGNCAMYDGNGLCLLCLNGYFYDLVAKNCILRPVLDACQIYANLGCGACKEDYFLQTRIPSHLNDIQISEFFLKRSDMIFQIDRQVNFYKSDFESCERKSDVNCEIVAPSGSPGCSKCKSTFIILNEHQTMCVPISDHFTPDCRYHSDPLHCQECKAEYYMTGSSPRCNEREHFPISGCSKFSKTQDRCDHCQSGYHMTSDGHQCLQMADNCVESWSSYNHQTSTEELICNRCLNDDFFLDATKNQCVKRESYQCLQFMPNSTECSQCQVDHILTNNNICVLKTDPNCNEYHIQSAICKRCRRNYFIEWGKCKKSDVENCSDHLLNFNYCAICDPQFYLKDGECIQKSDTICVSFDSNNGKCQICPKGYFVFDGECHVNSRPNCLDFEPNTNKCHSCREGYFQENFQCSIIDIHNCIIVQNSNQSFCQKCQKGYSLTSNHQCQMQFIKACIEYSTNNNVCTKCAAMYQLQNNSCVEEPSVANVSSPVSNCLIYDLATKYCVKCAAGFHNDGSSDMCNKSFIEHCMQYKINEEACTHCRQGFYPHNNGTCISQPPISRCKSYRSNAALCLECQSPYYTTNGTTCDSKYISGCYVFTPSGSEQRCEKCSQGNMYYLNRDGTECIPIDPVVNCMKSDGVNNKCQECLDSRHSVVDNTCRLADDKIHNCLENDQIQDKNKCTKCKDYYHLLEAFQHQDHHMVFYIEHCLDVNTETKRCRQCDWFYSLQADGTCKDEGEFYQHQEKKLFCGLMMPDAMGSIYNNQNCEQCPDEVTYYLTSAASSSASGSNGGSYMQPNQCAKRRDLFAYEGCAQMHSDNDVCRTCASGRSKKWVHPLICDRLNLPPVPNCKIRHGFTDACFMCEPNFALDDSVCREITSPAKILNSLDFELRITHTLHDHTKAIDGCEAYVQIHETDFGCVKCNGDLVGILEHVDDDNDETSGYRFGYFESPSTNANSGPNHDLFNIFTKCQDQNRSFRDKNHVLISGEGKCEIGYSIPGFEGHGCLKCKNNQIGKLVAAKYDFNNLELENGVMTVTQCHSNETIVSVTNHFISLRFLNSPSTLRLSSLIESSFCTIEQTSLVHLFYQKGEEQDLQFTTKREIDSSDSLSQARCVLNDKIDKQVDYCQMYFMSSELEDDITFDTHSFTNLECLICMKDFKPTYNSDKQIISCDSIVLENVIVLIFSIDINLKYNSSNLLARAFNETLFIGSNSNTQEPFDFETNLPENPPDSENCLCYDLDINSCVICNHDSWLSAGKCHFIRNDPFENRSSTTNLHRQSNRFQKQTQFAIGRIAKMFRRDYEYQNDTNIGSRYSQACKDGSKTMINTHETIEICEPDSTQDPNCLEHLFSDPSKCARCKKGFLLKLDQTCHDISNNPECISIDDGTLECYECKQTFFLNPNKICQQIATHPECISFDTFSNTCQACTSEYTLNATTNICEFDLCLWKSDDGSGKCAVCKDFYLLATNDDGTKSCSELTDHGNFCQNYSPTLGHCIKPRNHHHFSYIIKTRKDNITKIQFDGYYPVESILDSNFLNKSDIYIYVEFIFDLQTQSTQSYKLRILKTEKMHPVIYQDEISHFCFPKVYNPYCIEYDEIFCLKCVDYFYVNDFGHCSPTNISKCMDGKKENDIVQCTRCKDGRYLDIASNNCNRSRVQSNTTSCEKLHPSQDRCISCNKDLYLNASQLCSPNSAPKCSEKSRIANKCQSCVFGYYLDADGNCESANAINCKHLHPNKNECQECIPGYSKNAVNECMVVDHSFNCKTLAENKYNNCDQCSPLFYKNSENGACIRKTANNCKEYEANEDKCSECEVGFILRSTDCVRNLASNCHEYNEEQDQCESCLDLYVSKNGRCVPRTAPNCEAYHPTNDSCSECINHYTKNEDHMCEPDPNVKCTGYNGSNQCNSCENGYSLDAATNICTPNTVAYCIQYEQHSRLCAACDEGFYLTNSRVCLQNNVANCRIKKTIDSETCVLCHFGFWRDPTTGLCVQSTQQFCVYSDYSRNGCLFCQAGHSEVLRSDGGRQCVPEDSTENCTDQGFGQILCTQCQPGYFPSSQSGHNTCTQHTHVENCDLYRIDVDQCESCSYPYYYNQNNTQCDLVRFHIQHCTVYSDESNCLTCKSLYFKNTAGKCEPVTLDIPYCVEHDSIDTCSKCAEAKVLHMNNCHNIIIPNCRSVNYENELQVCDQCEEYLLPSATRQSCLEMETVKIQHCKYYESNQVCSECYDGYVLDQQRVRCLDIPHLEDYACEPTWFGSDSKCLLCQQGYSANSSGGCSLIPIDHCLLANQDNSECLICKENSYMDQSRTCKIQEIKHCKTHDENNEFCAECVDGFHKYSNIECDIPNRSECTLTHESLPQCVTCIAKRFLNEFKICSEIFSVKCQTPDNVNKTCVTCVTGFNKATDGTCKIPNKDHCLTEHASEPKCLECKSGFVLDNLSICQPFTLPFCKQTDTSFTFCLTCIDGYFLYPDKTCDIPDKDLCQTRHPTLPQCKICVTGKFLTRAKICTDMIPANCQTPDEFNETCMTCATGYQRYTGGICNIPLVENCQTPSTSEPKCLLCKTGKYMDRIGVCDDVRPANCKTPLQFNETCQECISDKYYITASKQCVEIYDANCATPNASNFGCAQCKEGYVLNTDGHCRIKNYEYCQEVNPDAPNCIKCYQGKWIDRLKICDHVRPEHCKIPDEFNEKCVECTLGYLKYTGSVCDIPNRDFCLVAHPTEPKCQTCKEGKFPDRNMTCDNIRPSNCKVPDLFNENCLTCINDTFFINTQSKCVFNNVTNCKLPFDNNTQCSVCQDGYSRNTTTLQCEIPNKHLCKEAHPSKPICVECIPLSFRNLMTSICEEINAPNCQLADGANEKCAICIDKYHLQSDKICRIQNHELCHIESTTAPKCIECINSSYIPDVDQGICFRINSPNCQKPDAANVKCILCESDFSLTPNGLCLPNNINNCKVLDDSIDLCKECRPGYVLSVDQKICQIPNQELCEVIHDSKPQCEKCIDDKFLSRQSICGDIFSRKCKTPDQFNEKCLDCVDGYNMEVDQSCQIPNFAFCEIEDQSGPFCVKCKSGKFIDRERICDHVRPKNCETPDEFNELCERCQAGKFRDKDKVCQTPTVPSCIIPDPDNDGKCVFCLVGVKLDLDSLSCVQG